MELFKKLDLFGQTVTLTFEKKTMYRTFCGAFFSLLLIIGIGGYALQNLSKAGTLINEF